jgi:hypothetical protein
MRTAAILGVVAVIAVIAVAGAALASGTIASTNGMRSNDASGRGMMGDHMGGTGMQYGNHQHMYQNNGLQGCQYDYDWNNASGSDNGYGGCPCMD